MIEALNFFQTLGIFGIFSRPQMTVAERRLSDELIKDARKFAVEAEIENRNGESAHNLTLDAVENNLQQNLAQIAVWHYRTSAKNYRQAAARYDEAARIRTDKRKALQNRVEEIIRLAEKSEQAVNLLHNFIN